MKCNSYHLQVARGREGPSSFLPAVPPVNFNFFTITFHCYAKRISEVQPNPHEWYILQMFLTLGCHVVGTGHLFTYLSLVRFPPAVDKVTQFGGITNVYSTLKCTLVYVVLYV
jgi:hypothetical protein